MASVFRNHTLAFLFRVCVNINISINTNFMFIYVYMCICMCMYVYSMCVYTRHLFTVVKLHVTKRGCLILWEMAPLLSTVQTVVIPRARGGRRSLMRRSCSQSAFLVHPSQVTVFYSDHLPSPARWSGERSVPVPMWQRGTSQWLLPAPRKNSLEEELWWQTSSRSQSCSSCWRLRHSDHKWFRISISHRSARMAWPQDPDIYRWEKETKPTPCKRPLLRSVCWLSLRLLINISLLTEPGRKSPTKCNLRNWGKGRRNEVLLRWKLYFREIKCWKMSRAQNEVFEKNLFMYLFTAHWFDGKKTHQDFDFFIPS